MIRLQHHVMLCNLLYKYKITRRHTKILRVTMIPGRIEVTFAAPLPAPQSTAVLFPTGAGDVGKTLKHMMTAATHKYESLAFLTSISSTLCQCFTVSCLVLYQKLSIGVYIGVNEASVIYL